MGLSIEVWSVILFGVMILSLCTGLPVVFVLGGVGTLFTILIYGFNATMGVYLNAWASFNSQMLLAIPLFLLMASVLQYSGIADEIYGLFHKWMGGLKGGLCIGTVVICMIFAAVTGTSGAATVSMGLIALPSMLKRGYNKYMAVGAIMGGGVLGIVIPPSIIMIIYSLIARLPIGKMFMGGVFPGITCGCIFIIYIAIRCWINPKNGPPIPLEERATWKEKLLSIKALILPLGLIVIVLGSIWVGIATPTEAAAIGAFGAFICAAVNRRLNWATINEAVPQTVMLTGMIFWILAGATTFSNLYTQLGARDMIQSFATGLDVSPWVIVCLMQLSLLVLGCIMDDFAIVMLAAPIYVPIVVALGFDPLWFGIVFILNMSIAYLTPPYGFNLFYMRSLVPIIKKETGVELTMRDIYRGAAPFIGLMIVNLILCMIFPEIITWFPNMIYG
jgi:tripartite ATP-independent transporter DctM subunit